jgi:hypothetical protein
MSRRKTKQEPPRRPPQLEELDGRIAYFRNLTDELEDERDTVALGLVKQALPEPPKELALGHHDCHASPTGECAYDDDADRAHDMCLFCGEPEERK